MAFPPGADCDTTLNTAAFAIIGPGVTVATGVPPGLSWPGSFGPTYIDGNPTIPGIYNWTINGLGLTSFVAGNTRRCSIKVPGIAVPSTGNVTVTVGVPSAAFLELWESSDLGVTWFAVAGTFYRDSDVFVSCGLPATPMPPGLTLQPNGTITGTPTVVGFYSIPIGSYDPDYNGVRGYLNIGVNPAGPGGPSLTCGGPPVGTVGTPYSHSFAASGGTAPYTYAITAGALPTGLTLSAGGAVSGTPTVAATYGFTVTATDAALATAPASCSITINAAAAALGLACGSPPAGTVGVAYSHTLPTTGGVPGYVYGLVTGLLPAGLSLNAAGQVTGLPAVAGTFAFTVNVTDSAGTVAAVNCAITIAAAALPAGAVVPISQQQAIPVILPDPTKEC